MKAEIEKIEGERQGRLSVEFRNRTKRFASTTIQLFVKLPKARDEVGVIGKQPEVIPKVEIPSPRPSPKRRGSSFSLGEKARMRAERQFLLQT